VTGIEAAGSGGGSARRGLLIVRADRFSSRKACIMLFESWIRQLTTGSATPSRCRGARLTLSRRSILPHLEVLEDRSLPSTLTVTSISDTGVSGDGSLRGEIAAAHSGDTIVFANNLHNKTITLTSGALPITASLTIDGLGENKSP
jgi:hypothetical protein